MISTGSIYTLHEHLCLTILNRGRRLLPDDQQCVLERALDLNRKESDRSQLFKEIRVYSLGYILLKIC